MKILLWEKTFWPTLKLLKIYILIHFKIIENLSGNNDRNTTNTPIMDKIKQKMTLKMMSQNAV